MRTNQKNNIIVIIGVTFITSIIIFGISYAVFTASISGNSQNINVKTAKLGSLTYNPINNLNLGDNIKPGTNVSDDFIVTYDEDGLDLTYDLEIEISKDTFNNIDSDKQLILTLKGNSDGVNFPIVDYSEVGSIKSFLNFDKIERDVEPYIEKTGDDIIVLDLTDGDTVKPSSDNKTYKIIKNIRISAHETHTYNMKLAFINYTSKNQDNNQEGYFNANIRISNVKVFEIPKEPFVANCSEPEIGCEVYLAGEPFYVLSMEDDDTVNLLTKYNLNVGNYKDDSLEGIQSNHAFGAKIRLDKYYNYSLMRFNNVSDILDMFIPNTYIGNIGNIMFGEQDITSGFKGTIPFDDPENCDHYEYNNKHTQYDGSTIKKYVDTYAEILNNKLMLTEDNSLMARLPEKKEIINNDLVIKYRSGIAEPIYGNGWLFNTSYWTSTVYGWDFNQLMAISAIIPTSDNSMDFYTSQACGVRPVVTISKSLLWK